MTKGFTVIEVLVAVFIFSLIILIPTGFYWGIGRGDALVSAAKQVTGTIHEAQTNTISGKSADGEQSSSYGVHFATTYYVLFAGNAYNPSDSHNERTDLPAGITLSQIQLPSSRIVFEKVTGTVADFDSNQHSIVLLERNTGKTKQITVSQAGAVAYE